MRASLRDIANVEAEGQPAETEESLKMKPAKNSEKSADSQKAVKKKTRSTARKPGELDPLYVIFEQHLLNFQDSDADRKTFIVNIVADYLSYLRKMNIVVPRSLEQPIVEELANQVNTMLVKKIYGCLSLEDYRKGVPGSARGRARSRYSKIKRNAA